MYTPLSTDDKKYPKETTLHQRKETDSVEEDGWENMPGGKAVAGDPTKLVSAPSRAAEDHTGASGPMSEIP